MSIQSYIPSARTVYVSWKISVARTRAINLPTYNSALACACPRRGLALSQHSGQHYRIDLDQPCLSGFREPAVRRMPGNSCHCWRLPWGGTGTGTQGEGQNVVDSPVPVGTGTQAAELVPADTDAVPGGFYDEVIRC